jgi:hypothetical protein
MHLKMANKAEACIVYMYKKDKKRRATSKWIKYTKHHLAMHFEETCCLHPLSRRMKIEVEWTSTRA